MLGVFSKSTPDGINKDLELTQVLAKKGLEFFPSDGDVGLILYLLLVLLPAKQGSIFKESSGK